MTAHHLTIPTCTPPAAPYGSPDWNIGDRVTRPLFMDDGTWAREGDTCLSHSPLRRGVVVSKEREPWNPYVSTGGKLMLLYTVRWDEPRDEREIADPPRYFWHGIAAE